MGQVGRCGRAVGVIILLVFMLWTAGVKAAEVPNFPSELSIGQSRCVLNGFGVRKKFIVDVYYGALYLTEKSSNPQTIIQADEAKGIVMHFVYKKVEAPKLVETWKEGFEKTAPNLGSDLKSRVEKFMGYFTEPVKKGEEIRLLYEPGLGTHVVIKGQEKGVVPGADFMQALWGIFLGDNPASESLKKGMLGQS
ncbi:chalcone isomerase family protein [Desulfosoma caldarium]|uniref:Chalcone isomerase-like protein n=1 Tax=Desulfosoma caldarium TaxID=610254 RepID=A0A3N1UQR0_9BACT|nr:chalcone isomerase family protein [Desulfosoma caldarium]ROQ93442.1 chalcone isomerase-like protein [Desulfosoma caldarium]